MKRLFITLALLVFFVMAGTLYVETENKFTGDWPDADTIGANDTVQHIVPIVTTMITGNFTITYWLGDSTKLRYWVTNDTTIGWFDMTLVDSTGATADSGNTFFSSASIIPPYAFHKWEFINWGDDTSSGRWMLKDRRD